MGIRDWLFRRKNRFELGGNSDGTITDTQTMLMWQREDDGQKRTLEESKAYCSSLRLGGYRDWRLPTIDELRSIAIVENEIFANSKRDEPYWSSTSIQNPGWEPVAGEEHKYVTVVMFSGGRENTYFQYYKYYTRAVRGPVSKAAEDVADIEAWCIQRAQSDLGGEDEQLAAEMAALCRAYDLVSNLRNEKDKAEYARIKAKGAEIGNKLCEDGGDKRMRLVAFRAERLGGSTRSIERMWDGIGEWMW